MSEPKTAEADGLYTIHDTETGEAHQFFVAKGDPIPEGATGFTAKPAEEGDAAPKPADAQQQSDARNRQRPGPDETR